MSAKVVRSFEVTNMAIMKSTLKRLKFNATKTEKGFSISRAFYDIEISKDKITCDSVNKSEIEKIQAEYQRDFQLNERALRGEVCEVSETKDEIVITVQ